MARPWHHSRDAQALLADCVANPPAYLTRKLASHERWTRDDETVSSYDRNDDRVDALIQLSNRAFEAAELAGVSKAVLRRWPDVDAVIASALAAGRKAA